MSSISPQTGNRPGKRYCFGEFTLDLEAGFLRRGMEEVTLRPKSFEVLTYLVEHHGRLVSKSTLIDAVWPDTVITDNSLAQCLLEIRRALADDAQQIIRTVKGRGYIFAAELKAPIIELPARPKETLSPPEAEPERRSLPASIRWKQLVIGALALSIVSAGVLVILRSPRAGEEPRYTQITDFTDSAVAPVLSPDGRFVAFFRSRNWWLTRDPIYVKMLPDGEPVKLTEDARPKCCIAFSPDGKEIAYTVREPGVGGWKTYVVPSLGRGEPRLLLSNATGLTWLEQGRFLFSEIRTGFHMGIVTASENRSGYRSIYFPKNERAMAHFSYASPDRNWALLVEMDPDWQPCRLIPLDGRSQGRLVGPQGPCTSAGWSPDGKWMYFGAEVGGSRHLWRQRFAGGDPEQITFGPTHEEGIAIAPDGRSLVTSIGIEQSAVWIHDADGERPLSSEGKLISSVVHGILPKYSSDGKSLFYLKRRSAPASGVEIWRTAIESGKSEPVLPGISVVEYDISDSGKEVVYSTRPTDKPSNLWLAALDRSLAPTLIASSGESLPHFGPDDQILFQFPEGNKHYVGRMNKDGSARSRVSDHPVAGILGISPDRRWIAAVAPLPDGSDPATIGISTADGATRRVCAVYCPAAWAPDGKYLYLGVERPSHGSAGKTLALPVPPGQTLPELPTTGIRLEDGRTLTGARIIEASEISPGPHPSFAYVKTTVLSNLFRIPLRSL